MGQSNHSANNIDIAKEGKQEAAYESKYQGTLSGYANIQTS